jgi:hypothetical protein
MRTYWKRWLPLLLVGSAILAYLWVGVYPTYRLRSLVRPRFHEIPLPTKSQQITAEKEYIVTECGRAGIGAYYASDLSWPELSTFYVDYLQPSPWIETTTAGVRDQGPGIRSNVAYQSLARMRARINFSAPSYRSLNPSHGFISSGWPMNSEHETMLLTIQPIVVRPADDDILNEAASSGKKVYSIYIYYYDRIDSGRCEDD